jgi:hypothetical protein
MSTTENFRLYEALVTTRFGCAPRGAHTLVRLYGLARTAYPSLCVDEYLCTMNCSRGAAGPEWKHAVRRVLSVGKRKGWALNGPRNGTWLLV